MENSGSKKFDILDLICYGPFGALLMITGPMILLSRSGKKD